MKQCNDMHLSLIEDKSNNANLATYDQNLRCNKMIKRSIIFPREMRTFRMKKKTTNKHKQVLNASVEMPRDFMDSPQEQNFKNMPVKYYKNPLACC